MNPQTLSRHGGEDVGRAVWYEVRGRRARRQGTREGRVHSCQLGRKEMRDAEVCAGVAVVMSRRLVALRNDDMMTSPARRPCLSQSPFVRLTQTN